jgi:hypothetical protein
MKRKPKTIRITIPLLIPIACVLFPAIILVYFAIQLHTASARIDALMISQEQSVAGLSLAVNELRLLNKLDPHPDFSAFGKEDYK